MLVFYRILLIFYEFIAWVLHFFNSKAKLWYDGRKDWRKRYYKDYDPIAIKYGHGPIWIHCASLGEFEQGRTIIEYLRLTFPDRPILLTFFSPSGYQIRKNYPAADYVAYLPLDSPGNASSFFKIFKPQLAIFVKYEFWYFYLRELKKNNVKSLLISAHFHENNLAFGLKQYLQKILPLYSQIFIQNEEGLKMLRNIFSVDSDFFSKVQIAGDTRFDRVIKISEKKEKPKGIETFINNRFCIVGGSLWEYDWNIILDSIQDLPVEEVCFIMVPHEINPSQWNNIRSKWGSKFITYSQYINEPNIQIKQIKKGLPQILCIDTIGILSKLYLFGNICFIGGGYNKGIHNTIEAAAYGRVIAFGKKYKRFSEAVDLVNLGVAQVIESAEDFRHFINEIQKNPIKRAEIEEIALEYVKKQLGATHKIVVYIESELKNKKSTGILPVDPIY